MPDFIVLDTSTNSIVIYTEDISLSNTLYQLEITAKMEYDVQ